MRSFANIEFEKPHARFTLFTIMSNARSLTAPAASLTTAGGAIICPRCQAKSKRTALQCAAPAMRGKRVCRFHGGKSTGPRTPQGLARCAAVKTTHAEETKPMREAHKAAAKRIKELEALAKRLGLFGRRWTPAWRRR